VATDGTPDHTAEIRRRPRATLPIALLEALLGVGLVAGAAAAVPGHWGLLDIQPHPLWLVVLAIAIRYGVPAGYAGGAFAAAGYCLLIRLQPGATAGWPAEHQLLQPILLFAGGAIIGELVHGRQQRLLHTEEALRTATTSLQRLTQRYQALQEVQGELEKRIVGQEASIASLYDAAKRMSSLDSVAVCEAGVHLVMEYLEAEACSLYLECDGRYEWRAGVPAAQPGRRHVLDTRHPLVSQALREHRLTTIRDQILQSTEPADHDSAILMVGPLYDSVGSVRGVVVVEQLPFLKFCPATIQLFGLLTDWVSTALQNAEAHERALVSAMLVAELAS